MISFIYPIYFNSSKITKRKKGRKEENTKTNPIKERERERNKPRSFIHSFILCVPSSSFRCSSATTRVVRASRSRSPRRGCPRCTPTPTSAWPQSRTPHRSASRTPLSQQHTPRHGWAFVVAGVGGLVGWLAG